MRMQEKEAAVSELREKFLKARVVVLTGFSGMDVGEIQEVKNQLRRVSGEFTVVKNTMAMRAVSGTAMEGIGHQFTGPIAVALGFGDPIAPAKVIKGMVEKQKKLKIKIGIVENQVIDLTGLTRIAQLPSRQVLLGRLATQFGAPLCGLVGSLNGVLNKLAHALHAVHEKRQASEHA